MQGWFSIQNQSMYSSYLQNKEENSHDSINQCQKTFDIIQRIHDKKKMGALRTSST